MWKIILILVILVVLFAFLYFRAKRKLSNLKFQAKSLSSKYGKMTEQFLPFLEDYPYAPQNFRFIGSPIDGVQFEDDKIIFIEFKTGNSQMTEKQKRIKELVVRKKVYFREQRID